MASSMKVAFCGLFFNPESINEWITDVKTWYQFAFNWIVGQIRVDPMASVSEDTVIKDNYKSVYGDNGTVSSYIQQMTPTYPSADQAPLLADGNSNSNFNVAAYEHPRNGFDGQVPWLCDSLYSHPQPRNDANTPQLSNGNQQTSDFDIHLPVLEKMQTDDYPILERMISRVESDVKDLDLNILYEEALKTQTYDNPILERMISSVESDVNDLDLNILYEEANRASTRIPVVEQKQTTTVCRGKRVIKVKALQLAEAAKLREQEKENERKTKKEAFKHALANRKKEKMTENELKKKKKNGAMRRQKVEEKRKQWKN